MISNYFRNLIKNDNGLDLVIGSIFTSIIFLFIYAGSQNLKFSLLISTGLFLFVLAFVRIEKYFGKKRHRKIIQSPAFQRLLSEGFQLEVINDYSGITGKYKGYIFDIYYDWSTYVRPKANRAVIFNVYFNPPLNYEGKTDHNHLIALSKKYDVSMWSFKPWNFWWREGNIIMRVAVNFRNPPYDKIIKWMDVAIGILQDENLKPVSREILNAWRKEFPKSNVPEISVYFKHSN